MLLWTLHMYFCKNMDAFLLCIFLGIEFLGHVSRFCRCCHTDFLCDYTIYTPTSSVWEFWLLYILTNIFSTSIIFKHGFKQKFIIQLTFLESLLCVRCACKRWDMWVLTLKQYIMLPPLLTHLTKIATSMLMSFYSKRDADRQTVTQHCCLTIPAVHAMEHGMAARDSNNQQGMVSALRCSWSGLGDAPISKC